jgi:hypothetical protein
VGSAFGFNRSALLVPLLAMGAVFTRRVARIRFAPLLVAGAVVALFAAFLGTYRTGALAVGRMASDPQYRSQMLLSMHLEDQLQIYDIAPQFLGYMLAHSDNQPPPAQMLLSSVLYPIPVLGKSFREHSGVTYYNRAIYGNTGVLDQIVPFQGELFVTLGFAGLIVGFALLGCVIGRLQRGSEESASAYGLYWRQYLGAWTVFLVQGSLASVSQILVYYCWPIYLLGVYSSLRSKRKTRLAPSTER